MINSQQIYLKPMNTNPVKTNTDNQQELGSNISSPTHERVTESNPILQVVVVKNCSYRRGIEHPGWLRSPCGNGIPLHNREPGYHRPRGGGPRRNAGRRGIGWHRGDRSKRSGGGRRKSDRLRRRRQSSLVLILQQCSISSFFGRLN